jgi:hypothetical protein
MDTDFLPDLTFNPAARVQARRIGTERQPLLVIDNVMCHPDQMVRYAVQFGDFKRPPEGSYYPGVNGEVPPGYGPALVQALRPLLHKVFGIPQSATLIHEGFFGLTTTPPQALQPLQTVPHVDSSNPYRLAMVHYFCGEPYRGTAFFRHLTTAFESVDYRRFDTYRDTVGRELETLETPRAYVDRDTPRYKQIDYVEAMFDRLAVYRTTSLHAAVMTGAELSDDPAVGRLTANSFIQGVRPG